MAGPSNGIDVITLTVAVVLAAAIVLLLAQIVPQLTDLMMMPPPLSGGHELGRWLRTDCVSPTLESMQAEDFLERERPGVAAVVVLSALLEWLCVSKQLSPDDLNLIFDDAEDRVAGDLNVLKDARIVIAMMRARLSSGTAKPTPSVPPAGFLVFGPLPPSWSACVTPKFGGGGSRARRLVCRALRVD